jgi:hypothetical protein
MPQSLDVIFLTLAFAVPGFVWYATYSLGVPPREERSDHSFLRFLTLSCVNYAIWSWLIYLLVQPTFLQSHPYRRSILAAFWFVVIFVAPVGLGLLLGRRSHRALARSLLQRLGFHPLHEQPTAWDYIFRAIDTPLFALVTFKDGSTVGGLVANGTFASSQPRERDLYLERVYNVASDGAWQETPNSAGILIRGDEIRHIEFWGNWVDGDS